MSLTASEAKMSCKIVLGKVIYIFPNLSDLEKLFNAMLVPNTNRFMTISNLPRLTFGNGDMGYLRTTQGFFIRSFNSSTKWSHSVFFAILWSLKLISAQPWWRHQMKTFFALLAFCAGRSPVTGEFPAQRPVTRSFDGFFLSAPWINGWANIREAVDLRRHPAHYDVIVMAIRYLKKYMETKSKIDCIPTEC